LEGIFKFMTKVNKQDRDNKNKRRRGGKFMSIKEADIKKGWTEMETVARRGSAAPPNIDSNSTDLGDLFQWGAIYALRNPLIGKVL
jgi:hypothetical protein